jgi:two-component system, NtrC family, sensor histidine kinase HydH
MNVRFLSRMVIPILAISALPLGIGVWTAWQVQTSQKRASRSLGLDVAGMRAGEELAIGIRDIRDKLHRYLLTDDRKYLEAIPSHREDMAHWIVEAERAAVTARERELSVRLKTGYESFFAQFDRIMREPAKDLRARVRELTNETLTDGILEPAQAYLDFNEEEIALTNAENQKMADRMILALLPLGLCGPVSGLLCGYGIARGVSRSILRLSVPIRDTAGRLTEIVGPITLSARWSLEELEAVLHRIAEHVGAVVTRLQQSQREASRAEQLAAVGQLAAGMAHELRNPLTAMKVLVQAAAHRTPRAAVEGRDLVVLDDEMTRLEHLIQTFLDFARPPQMEKQCFELCQVLSKTADLVSGRAERQGVHLKCELSDLPVMIEADLGQIRQVILNLLLNALDAMPQGGVLWLRLATPSPDGWLQVQVADTGYGLPAALGQRVFEPFVSTKETGIGLGLSICKRIVEAHGGAITAADRPGGGALFTVRLPTSLAAQSALLAEDRAAAVAG